MTEKLPTCPICGFTEDQTGEILQANGKHKHCESHIAHGGRSATDHEAPYFAGGVDKDLLREITPKAEPLTLEKGEEMPQWAGLPGMSIEEGKAAIASWITAECMGDDSEIASHPRLRRIMEAVVARARAEALEEAAKIAQKGYPRAQDGDTTARELRALAEKP